MSAVVQSKTVRIMAILQLCIIFTVIMSSGGYPFMGELFSYKSKALLYHVVMGDTTLISSIEGTNAALYKNKLERNKHRFSLLPEEQQEKLLSQYKILSIHSEKPFWNKIKRSFQILIFELPAFERAWLLFSLIISILLLLHVENASKAAWLLPFIVVCYIWNNQLYGDAPYNAPDTALFPTEELIVREYMQEPLSDNIMEQQPQLLMGWKRYLVQKWTDEQHPSEDSIIFEQQVEKGEFAFNVARLESLSTDSIEQNPFHQKISLGLAALFFFWNVLFAIKVRDCMKTSG